MASPISTRRAIRYVVTRYELMGEVSVKYALVFPGQGSQFIGMGREAAQQFPAASLVFQEVDEALGQNLSQLMWQDGDEEWLNLTINAQPALMATSMSILRALESVGFSLGSVAFLAGHSLGEYSALCASGALSLADTARLLRWRGEAMQKAVPVGEGGMAAVLGVDLPVVEMIAGEAAEQGVCEVANDNDPKQAVISGHAAQIVRAIEIAASHGVRRTLRLNTSAPFHCSLMQPAAESMRHELAKVRIHDPAIPIIANVTAEPVADADTVQRLLVEQVTGRVRWRETIMRLEQEGVTSIIELGAGKALCGMIRRTAPAISTHACIAPDEIHALVDDIGDG